MAEADQSFSIEVDAGIDDCVEVLLDFARYPQWSGPITSCRVVEPDAQGRGRRVEFVLDMKIRNVRYVLEYSYDLPARATWSLVEGDVSSIRGVYEFEPMGPARTRATCQQAVDVGFWIPGPFKRVFERQALRESVMDFKREVERRAQQRGSAKS